MWSFKIPFILFTNEYEVKTSNNKKWMWAMWAVAVLKNRRIIHMELFIFFDYILVTPIECMYRRHLKQRKKKPLALIDSWNIKITGSY